MVVEEVAPEGKITGEAAKTETPVEEKNELLGVVKEKVGELQDINEHISGDIEKSSEVHEEIVEAAEKVEPAAKKQEYPVPSYMERRTGLNPLIIIIPGVLLLGALLGGVYFYQTSLNKNAGAGETPSPTVAPPLGTPTASPSASLNLSKYTLKVLNGSGIPGAANEVKSILTKAGFKVGTTGNATSYDFTKTIIKAKTDADPAFLSKLSETLAKTYVLDTNQTLSASSTDDIQIIVGSSKAQ